VLEIHSFSICRECNINLLFIEKLVCGFLIFEKSFPPLSVCAAWNRMGVCMQEWVSRVQKSSTLILKIISMFFGKVVDNSKEANDMRLLLWISELWLLLLMLLFWIIIKCWMLSFMVCFFFPFFLMFHILYKTKKLLYFALLWTASHGAFIDLLLCQFTLFLSY